MIVLTSKAMLPSLDQRSQEILRRIVDGYLQTGEPVGSKTLSAELSAELGSSLSPATIRNVMASLQDMGLLHAPHTSAGRLPTELGLRLFVDGLLEVGSLTREEKESITATCQAQNRGLSQVMDEAITHLSGLSNCAGLVVAPTTAQAAVKHIEFIYLEPGRALVVLVFANGQVENRLVDIPKGLPAASLQQASNYLNAKLSGNTLTEAATKVKQELVAQQAELDRLTTKLVEEGLAMWSGDSSGADPSPGPLIIRGQSHLLETVQQIEDIHRLHGLFQTLETKESVFNLLEATQEGDGVQIFIGSENELFGLSGCSMVISSFRDENRKVIGAIGVIGPVRINYGRIIPMVDYTAKVVTKLLA